MGETSKDIGHEVKSGDSVDITIKFKAPSKIGRYSSFYRFGYGKSKKFGTKVWCEA